MKVSHIYGLSPDLSCQHSYAEADPSAPRSPWLTSSHIFVLHGLAWAARRLCSSAASTGGLPARISHLGGVKLGG